MHFNPKSQRLLFYSLWIVFNLWQASETELLADEAYYWMFSNELAWGYFDQPPLIAFLVKLGYSIFQNELGVRLFPVLLFTAAIYFLEKLIAPKNFFLFASLFVSLGALHFTSFFAAPDSPLFFFGVLYLYLLKKQFEAASSLRAILLGIVIGSLLLSKYHGGLLLLFTLVANPRLLITKAFWLSTSTALLVFSPHLYWLIKNDFVSVLYHLGGRGPGVFELRNLANYLVSVFAFYAPFTALLAFYGIIKSKTTTDFDRTLKVILFGILLFCLLLTVRGNIEINWITLTFLPLIYLGYYFLESQLWAKKLHERFFPIGLCLILAVRVALASDTVGTYFAQTPLGRFHAKKKTVQITKNKFGSDPVIFLNSFQRASLYTFYSKQEAVSLNSFTNRKNQFDLWSSATKYNNKKVRVVLNYIEPALDSIITPKGVRTAYVLNNFYTMSDVVIDAQEIRTNKSNELTFKLQFEKYESHLAYVEENKARLCLFFYKGHKNQAKLIAEKPLTKEMLEKGYEFKCKVPNLKKGYAVGFGLRCDPLPATLNSKILKTKTF